MEVPISVVIWLFSGLIGAGLLIATVKNILSSLKEIKDDVRDLSTRQATSLSIGVLATPRTPAITGSPEQHIIENNKENNN